MDSKDNLYRSFFVACDRIHSLVSDMYEKLHDVDVEDNQSSTEEVSEIISEFRNGLNIEIDMIRELVKQHNES